jgi:hypothetical protein
MNQFDMSPQFGFVQSSMPGLPTVLDQINPSYYSQIANFIQAKGGRLASITGVVLYDTLRADSGIFPLRDFVFFQNALGQQQGLLVAGTSYTKQEIDVSPWIVGGGQLAKGYEALIWGIGVQFHVVGALDDSLQTSGNFINLALDPGSITSEVAADGVKMGNLMRVLQESLYFQLFVNQTGFEDGPGWRFPAGPYGITGFASMCSGATAPAFAVTDGAANNGFGWSYQMPIMRHIPELTKFGVRMKIQNPFTTANVEALRIVVTLEGIGIQPVTG